MARAADFHPDVPLPPGLTVTAIRKSIEYIESELAELVDIYHEQANVFSALVGIYGVRALDSFSVYEKSRHRDEAQQRFPDLKRRGAPARVPAKLALESKGSKRPWELQSHYDHPGWYIVWRYLVDSNGIHREGQTGDHLARGHRLPDQRRLGIPNQQGGSKRRWPDAYLRSEKPRQETRRQSGLQAIGDETLWRQAHTNQRRWLGVLTDAA